MAKKAQIGKSKYQHEVTINGTTVIKETKTSNAQRKANQEYDKKIDRFTVRLPQGSKEKINKYVTESNKYSSVNAMIKALLENEIGETLD